MSGLVPGYPSSSVFPGNAPVITPTASAVNIQLKGTPQTGDVVKLNLYNNNAIDVSASTLLVTVSGTLTSVAVANSVATAIEAATGDWSNTLVVASTTASNALVSVPVANVNNWGLIGVGVSLTLGTQSTLSAPKMNPAVPEGLIVVTVVPVQTFAYTAPNGQNLTFYQGQNCDVSVDVALDLRSQGLVT